MSKAGGYIFRLSAARLAVFRSTLAQEEPFAEPVTEFSYSRQLPLICFVLNGDGFITHMGSGKRGLRAGTGLRRLNLSDVFALSAPISAERVIERIPQRTSHWVRDRLENGGLIPPKSFEHLVDAVLELAPETRDLIERYSSARRERLGRLSPEALKSLAAQKETVATALAIAGFDREPLQSWVPQGEATPESFLDGLSTIRLREDPMVVKDLMTLPGYEFIKMETYAAAVFESEKKRLTTILANRQPLEEQLGTDLIYYNHSYKSFVMVQYKAMEQEKNDTVFRIPNEQLTEEIRRMDQVLEELYKCTPDDGRDGFRLNENPFFLKFCPRIVFNPDDLGLVPGMYLPLDYWRRTETHSALLGPLGGSRLTYRNVGRYFDNTSFVTLVANAWIGTTHAQSAVLEKAIRETLESGKAVMVAVKTDDPDSDPDGINVSDYDPTEGLSSEDDLAENEQFVEVRQNSDF